MSDAGRHVSLDELEKEFMRELHLDKRAAAETAYALAFLYRNNDIDGRRRFDLAKTWASRAIEILDSLPVERIDQIVSTRQSVGGVLLPDLLHSDMVRTRLADVLV